MIICSSVQFTKRTNTTLDGLKVKKSRYIKGLSKQSVPKKGAIKGARVLIKKLFV